MSIIEEEEIVKLKCNRCTGRTLVEEDFPLKKRGVGRTKSCKFCVEYQVKYEKEKTEELKDLEKSLGRERYQDKKEKKEQDDINNGVVNVVKSPEHYMTCECGLEIMKKNRYRHIKSKKHLDLMKITN
jgi:hypothetical protein